jgi:circadian clock protein KaiB
MIKNESQDNTGKGPAVKEFEYVLRLYISGASTNSVKAVNNIKQICEGHIKNKYILEVIDVHQQQKLAEKEQLIALPMLIRKKPLPEKKLIGDMSDTKKVLKGLGLPD